MLYLFGLFIIVIFILIILYWSIKYRYENLKKQYEELLKVKRSENVKHGQTWEQFVPFAKDFPFSKNDFKFIGQPIDGIVFADDKISFVEIKTGSSGLNVKQREIRKLIEDKKVEWREVRY